MIALDEDALICDFAETYHIYDLYRLPADYAAILACGLREGSRIRMKQAGLRIDLKELLLARIVDNTAINVYSKTKDAKKGKNYPKSITKTLTEQYDPSKHAMQFETGADFDKKWRELNGH